MLKGITEIFLIVAIAVSTLCYIVLRKDEKKSPPSVGYEKSTVVKAIVPKKIYEKFSLAMPRTATFVFGLDPKVSNLAPFRWAFLIFIGWLYFCFVSPYPKRFDRFGWTRSDLFYFPLTTILVLSLTGIILSGHESLSAGIMIVVIAVGSLLVGVSILSIPIGVAVWVIMAVRKFSGQRDRLEPSKKPEIPSPIVKRKLIDGVWYDQ